MVLLIRFQFVFDRFQVCFVNNWSFPTNHDPTRFWFLMKRSIPALRNYGDVLAARGWFWDLTCHNCSEAKRDTCERAHFVSGSLKSCPVVANMWGLIQHLQLLCCCQFIITNSDDTEGFRTGENVKEENRVSHGKNSHLEIINLMSKKITVDTIKQLCIRYQRLKFFDFEIFVSSRAPPVWRRLDQASRFENRLIGPLSAAPLLTVLM